MSKVLVFAKMVAVVGVASGVTSSPFLYNSQSTSPAEKKKKFLNIGKTDKKGGGFFLSNIDAIDQLLNKKKIRLNVEDVGLTFAGKKLSKQDILSAPCIEEGKYYLLKYIGDRHREGPYELLNGKRAWTIRCQWKHLYEGLEYINLDWARPTSGKAYKPTIYLDSCFFTKDKDNSIRITCDESGGWGSKITEKFGEKDYEYA